MWRGNRSAISGHIIRSRPAGALLALALTTASGLKSLALGISGFTKRLIDNEHTCAETIRAGINRFLVD